MLKPILDRILVKRINEEATGTIVIPDSFKEVSRKGEVLAIGQFVVLGNQVFPLSDFINVGDIVLFGEYNAEKFSIDGNEVLIVRIQDVRGKAV